MIRNPFATKHPTHVLDALRRTELFADCSDRELTQVMRFGTILEVPAGRVLTRQGELGRECFVITDGATRIERNGRAGLPTQGEVVGELALLDRVPRTATVTTTIPTKVFAMSPREFTGLCRSNIGNVTPRIEAAAEAHRSQLATLANRN